jgi:hypothetical protein
MYAYIIPVRSYVIDPYWVLYDAWSVDKVDKFIEEVKLPDRSQLLGGWGKQIG